MITLTTQSRKRLRQALITHRQSFELTEAEYVKKVLKVALNTYKKCIAMPDGGPLSVKRQTLISLLKSAKIAPASLGINLVIPTASDQFGGYDPEDYADLVGVYLFHRRSFLTGLNIVRGLLEIKIDVENRCLGFEEYGNYLSDAGLPDEYHYVGQIYINQERNVFSMLAFAEGRPRLMMTQGPVRASALSAAVQPRGGIRLRGALLTHGKPKGVLQPALTAIAAESLPQSQWKNARSMCRTIWPDDPEFQAQATELAYAENYGTIMTPLMWHREQASKGAR